MMNCWRWTWAGAQITGVLVSSVVWLIVLGLSLPTAAGVLGVGLVYVLGRDTRAGLWWRFGARPATGFEREQVGEAIVPVASLRGRRQPTIWIGRRLGGRDAVMPTDHDLVVSEPCLTWIVAGELGEEQVSAIVSHALGQQPVDSSAPVAACDAYCWPWGIVTILTGGVNRAAVRAPLLGFAWKVRWVVFAAAIIDTWHNGRWVALLGVATIAILSWSTGVLNRRWADELQGLGDRRVVLEGFGQALATMIRRNSKTVSDHERAEALSRGTTN